MTLADTIRKLVADFLRDTMSLTLEYIYSNGREPIIFRHASGAIIELRDDGFVYINGTKVEAASGTFLALDGTSTMTGDVDVGDNDVVNVTKISGAENTDFTIEIDTGRNILFVERAP